MNVDQNQPLPSRKNHNCFGCSPRNDHGLKMVFFADGDSVFSRITVPDHLCGWDHLVHGGVIATMLDEIMGRSAIHLLQKAVLTKSISVDFLKPVPTVSELKVEGKVLEVRHDREALMAGFLYNASGELCAKSEGRFALFKTDDLRKKGVFSEAALADLEHLMGKST